MTCFALATHFEKKRFSQFDSVMVIQKEGSNISHVVNVPPPPVFFTAGDMPYL